MAELVRRSYTGLQQIKANYTDSDVYNSCLPAQTIIDAPLPEYAQTVLNWVGLMGSGYSVTVGGEGNASLTAHFTKDEYGWPDVAVRNAVATLLTPPAASRPARPGALLEGAALAQALKTGRDMDKLVVAKVDAVPPERLAKIKSAYRNLVGTNPVGGDAKTSRRADNQLEQELPTFRAPGNRARRYPSPRISRKARRGSRPSRSGAATGNGASSQFPRRRRPTEDKGRSVKAMKQFIEGSHFAAKWNEVKAFGETGLVQMRDLGIDVPAELEEALAVAATPNATSPARFPARRAP